ncbi:hypothetical protein B0T26DRAFT_798409 [Lasiosphaeria miniovina]|uniref:Uncharacterized protein n=1 Tax=Lasiosphaeria miniovina TaxID=1954250 RepID=A0AA40EAN5_9PEZI|nr:uncharacterized protein B0T26DRAFT_798409 [Lasiosphaeria miniovina]KAK0734599.1 hypothetical protein B0T26DRAFT_798409 [Lasiosphaeria miniovina]
MMSFRSLGLDTLWGAGLSAATNELTGGGQLSITGGFAPTRLYALKYPGSSEPFDGKSCVFLASQICPNSFTLDDTPKSVCIGKSLLAGRLRPQGWARCFYQGPSIHHTALPASNTKASALSLDPATNVCVSKDKDPSSPDGTTLDKDKVKCITRSCFVMLACPDVFDDTAPAIGGDGSPSPAVGSGTPSSPRRLLSTVVPQRVLTLLLPPRRLPR